MSNYGPVSLVVYFSFHMLEVGGSILSSDMLCSQDALSPGSPALSPWLSLRSPSCTLDPAPLRSRPWTLDPAPLRPPHHGLLEP